MARVTIEDCEEIVKNRFLLVALAAQRVKQFDHGAKSLVECSNKPCVVALKEIAYDALDVKKLQNATISGLQHYAHDEEDEEIEDTYDPSVLLDNVVEHGNNSSIEETIDFSYIIQEDSNDL